MAPRRPPSASQAAEQGRFGVSAILSCKDGPNGTLLYEVLWEGYPRTGSCADETRGWNSAWACIWSDTTWEPLENLQGCEAALRLFERQSNPVPQPSGAARKLTQLTLTPSSKCKDESSSSVASPLGAASNGGAASSSEQGGGSTPPPEKARSSLWKVLRGRKIFMQQSVFQCTFSPAGV